MGKRGPSPKPYEIRRLEGTAGLVIALPTNDEFAEIPKELDAFERTVWRRTMATFPPGYFKSADERLLASYCRVVARCEMADAKIKEEGAVLKTEFGWKKNPWCTVLAEAHQQKMQLGDRLGVGPARRALSLPAANAVKQAEKKKGLFFEGGQTK